MNTIFKTLLSFQLILFCFLHFSYASLNKALKDYETLHHDTFRHRITKRDIHTSEPEERHVEFDTFGRHFNMILRRDSSVLASDFQVIAVDENNVERVVDFHPSVYHGYLADEPDTSVVNAYWEDESTLTASIRTRTDVYAIEPSWRFLPNSSQYSMISYRGSDLRMEEDLGKHFCGFVRAGEDGNYSEPLYPKQDDNFEEHIEGLRFKRASSCSASYTNPVCRVILVADFRFFQKIGSSNLITTSNYLIGLMDKVNGIYGETSFDSCGKGFGFEIGRIQIYQSSMSVGSLNEDKSNWDTNDLLEVFSRDSTFKDYCLAHLFTAIPFDNGVLGLAYIGGSRPYSLGGVCSPSYVKGGYRLYLNTGWSSSLSRGGRLLLTLESTLVTAHEYGHNWGSEHDADTSECSPSSSSGGKYIMYTYSVSGMETNNKLFSPCSQRSMGAVLQGKASTCFQERSNGFCGNFKVENDEQCDAGTDSNNACCDNSCKLKFGKQCSDSNDLCCKNCLFADSSTVCEDEQTQTCSSKTYCSGYNKTCPTSVPLQDGTPCNDHSYCSGGKCLGLCEFNNRVSCICAEERNACKWCCKGSNNSCEPFNNVNLPNAMPCFKGICNDKGQCEERILTQNLPRLWEVIEFISVNQLVKFMRANIAGTVIVLSLIIWIPICVTISFIDYKWKHQNKHKKLLSEDFAQHPGMIMQSSSIKFPSKRPWASSDDRVPLIQ